jgi:glycosyltransferase involved in cell wall biosynthesis
MILHLNTASSWRGGERQSLFLAEGLKKRNIPQIIVGVPGSELEKRAKDNFTFIPLKMRGEWDISSVLSLIKIIKNNNIKLIHTHTARAHTIALIAKYLYPNFSLVVSRRVDFHINKNIFSKMKYTSSLVDLFLTVSNKIKDILIEDGVDPEKIITVYSGIDPLPFKTKKSITHLKKEFSIPPKTTVIGNVAALVDHKDQETLIKAVALLPSSLKYKLLIVGEGELEAHLKSIVKALNLEDKVVFTGFRTDIPDLLRLFHIFALTSKEEGLGTSVLDAMMCQLPLVVTKGGGIPEMVDHEKGGYIAEVKDIIKIYEYLQILIKDSSLRKQLGTYNGSAVKKFFINATIEKTIYVYSSLLGERFWE